jgi:hypothetical protein
MSENQPRVKRRWEATVRNVYDAESLDRSRRLPFGDPLIDDEVKSALCPNKSKGLGVLVRVSVCVGVGGYKFNFTSPSHQSASRSSLSPEVVSLNHLSVKCLSDHFMLMQVK